MLTSIMKSLNGGGRNEMMNLYTHKNGFCGYEFSKYFIFLLMRNGIMKNE